MAPLAATAVDNGVVLMLVILIVLPIAAVLFARSGPTWRRIGSGPFAIDPDIPQRRPPELVSPVDPAIQEAEARHKLEAKSYRRLRRGQEPLDVEAETERQVADFIGLGK